jgi:ABC-2 type transport system ATP-binding protein
MEARGMTKRFGDLVAVDRIDLSVEKGGVHGLLGRNGAGKTTLLRMVLGLLAPDSGSLRLFGQPAPAGDVVSRQAVAGFVEEPRFYPHLSAQRNLELLARLDGPHATLTPRAALELVDLAGRRRERVGNFSTGMRQRLGLASALVRSPQLMVLDEPTIGLDPANSLAIRSQLRTLAESGVAVLMSSHNMTEVAEICDQVSIMHQGGTVWEGTQADLHLAAPMPAWRVWTSDDARAATVAGQLPVRVETGGRRPGGAPLTIYADDDQRDALVFELARSSVAVRRLEPDVPPLEALFTALTGPADEAAA